MHTTMCRCVGSPYPVCCPHLDVQAAPSDNSRCCIEDMQACLAKDVSQQLHLGKATWVPAGTPSAAAQGDICCACGYGHCPCCGFRGSSHSTCNYSTNFLPAPLSCFPVPGRHDFQPAKVCQDGVNWGFPAVELARPWLCAWLLPAVLKPFAQLQMCNFLE